jgi:hypothetical protein
MTGASLLPSSISGNSLLRPVRNGDRLASSLSHRGARLLQVARESTVWPVFLCVTPLYPRGMRQRCFWNPPDLGESKYRRPWRAGQPFDAAATAGFKDGPELPPVIAASSGPSTPVNRRLLAE